MRSRLPLALILAPLLLLTAGCGKQEQLRPRPGEHLPPQPATAAQRPGVAQLLTPSPEARPERNAEQIRRSRERAQDPFDLPPAN